MIRQLKYPLPLADYCRIFRVIYSVLEGRANTHRACIFFAITGSLILRHHYGLKAFPVAGAAAYMLNADTSLVATFGKIEGGHLVSSQDAFHCWIECNEYAIDLMAPIFRENLQAAGVAQATPRRMFQRPLADMLSSLDDFDDEGEFCLAADEVRTREVIGNFMQKPSTSDLANICVHWYRKPSRHIANTFDIRDDLGKIESLKLRGPDVTGVW